MRISDWSSVVCFSDLIGFPVRVASCAEAWIETETEVYELSAVTVASCAEAWIETIGYPLPIMRRWSRLLRGGVDRNQNEVVLAWQEQTSHPARRRMEERRVGKAVVSTLRNRRSPYP